MSDKKAAPKKVAEHPTYAVMVKAALVALKDRKGTSKIAIGKYICANYKVGPKFNGPLKQALKKGVESGALTQVKGIGASGSFKIAKVEKPAVKKPAAKKPAAKKPAAKKSPKKAAAKKPAAKKPAAKKSPKKAVKKPVAKKPAAKKATTPKKAGKVTKKASPKKAVKKTVAKKPAAKKAKK